MINNSRKNDSKSDDLLQKKSSQESQHSRKTVVAVSLNTSRRQKKVKKIDFKKVSRVKARQDYLNNALTQH